MHRISIYIIVLLILTTTMGLVSTFVLWGKTQAKSKENNSCTIQTTHVNELKGKVEYSTDETITTTHVYFKLANWKSLSYDTDKDVQVDFCLIDDRYCYGVWTYVFPALDSSGDVFYADMPYDLKTSLQPGCYCICVSVEFMGLRLSYSESTLYIPYTRDNYCLNQVFNYEDTSKNVINILLNFEKMEVKQG